MSRKFTKQYLTVRQKANHKILNAILDKMDTRTVEHHVIGKWAINRLSHDEVILLAKRHNLEPIIEVNGYKDYRGPVQDLFDGSTNEGKYKLLTEISLLNDIRVDENHPDNGLVIRSIAYQMDIDMFEISVRVHDELEAKNRNKKVSN